MIRSARPSTDCGIVSPSLFHRQIARPGTVEQLVDVARSVAELVKNARAEAHQCARLGKLAELGGHRHLMLLAKLDDPHSIRDLNCVFRCHHGLGPELHGGLEAPVKVVGLAQLERVELHSELGGGRLYLFQLLDDAGIGDAPEHGEAGKCREDLL